jgi:hypothetical protein
MQTHRVPCEVGTWFLNIHKEHNRGKLNTLAPVLMPYHRRPKNSRQLILSLFWASENIWTYGLNNFLAIISINSLELGQMFNISASEEEVNFLIRDVVCSSSQSFVKRKVRGGSHYFDSCHIKCIGLFVISYHTIRRVSNRSGILVTVINSKGKYKFHVIDIIFLFSGSYSYYDAIRMEMTSRYGGYLKIMSSNHSWIAGKESSSGLGVG